MKRRTVITIACLTIALDFWLIVYLCTVADSGRFTVVSNGPLHIRLWGIRPNDGDPIYDPNGRKIMNTFGINRRGTTLWKDGLYRHDFICEILDANEPVTFSGLRFCTDGEEIPWSTYTQGQFEFDYEGRKLSWLQTTLPQTKRKSLLFGMWKRKIRIDSVDLSLQYYCGPPRKAICTFGGPFQPGVKLTDDTGLYEIWFAPEPNSPERGTWLWFSSKKPIRPPVNALFYDTEGKRYLSGARGWPRASKRSGMRFGASRLSLKDIVMITIGEEPFRVTFKNISLTSLASEDRRYAEHLHKIAERLDPDRSPVKWAQHRFADPNEILKVIDIIRGEQIYTVCKQLRGWRGGKRLFDPASIEPELSQKLRQTVLGWTGAIDPEISSQAVSLGLYCRWPEFADIALDMLDCSHHNRYLTGRPAHEAADALESYRRNLSEQNIERIAELLPHEDDSHIFYRLQRCLEYPKSPARVIAMWALADYDRPWLYVPAIRYLDSWHELDGKHDSLPERFKIRVFLIAGPDGFSDPNEIAPKASALLLALLSDQLLNRHSGTFTRLLRHVPESIDRKAVTTAIAESLRGMEYRGSWSIWEAIDRSVRHLNHWHDLNIGGLGSDIRKMTPDLNRLDFEAIAAEAIEWYDSEYKAADPNSPG